MLTEYARFCRSGDGIIVSGKHYLLLSPAKTAMVELRTAMDQVYAPMVPFFAKASRGSVDASAVSSSAVGKSPLGMSLPAQLQVGADCH